MNTLPYRLDRTVTITASRETVFRFFTDSARWASWWGAGSTIEARPGGPVYIRHPNGVETLGEVVEVQSPERIVFTYGFASGKPIPPGSSRVTIRLEEEEGGGARRARARVALPALTIRKRSGERGPLRRSRACRCMVHRVGGTSRRQARANALQNRHARDSLSGSVQPARRPGRPDRSYRRLTALHAGDPASPQGRHSALSGYRARRLVRSGRRWQGARERHVCVLAGRRRSHRLSD